MESSEISPINAYTLDDTALSEVESSENESPVTPYPPPAEDDEEVDGVDFRNIPMGGGSETDEDEVGIAVDFSPELNVVREFRKDKHSSYVYSLVVYEEIGVIVSGSWDSTIKIWGIDNGECLKTIKTHHGDVNDIIKWNNDTFLSVGGDNCCSSFNICQKEILGLEVNELTKFQIDEKRHRNIYKILKLQHEDFICNFMTFSTDGNIHMLSYTKSDIKLVKVMNSEKSIGYNTYVLHSKMKSDSYFLTLDFKDRYHIKRKSYRSDEIEKVYKHHPRDVWCIESYISSTTTDEDKKFEILIAGSNEKMFFYNSETTECFRKVGLKRDVANAICWIEQARYLCVGMNEGGVIIFRLQVHPDQPENVKIVRSERKRVQGKGIGGLRCFAKKSSSVSLVSCADDELVVLTEISNINLLSKERELDMMDLRERVEYLRSEEFSSPSSFSMKLRSESWRFFKLYLMM